MPERWPHAKRSLPNVCVCQVQDLAAFARRNDNQSSPPSVMLNQLHSSRHAAIFSAAELFQIRLPKAVYAQSAPRAFAVAQELMRPIALQGLEPRWFRARI